MTTYNSYEAAKIANPECDIYATKVSMGGRVEVFGVYVIIGNITSNYHICDPSKYCMTVEKFLADGYKFVGGKGDAYLDSKGIVRFIGDNGYSARCCSDVACINNPHESFILRAAALEKKPGEKVKWDGEGLPTVGVECEAVFVEHEHKGYGQFLILGYHSGYVWMEYVGELSNKSKHYTSKVDLVKFRKPETPQQREDRERLEAAYDLYLSFWSASKSSIILESYDEFSSQGNSDLKHFLAVVDKTNYRKEVE